MSISVVKSNSHDEPGRTITKMVPPMLLIYKAWEEWIFHIVSSEELTSSWKNENKTRCECAKILNRPLSGSKAHVLPINMTPNMTRPATHETRPRQVYETLELWKLCSECKQELTTSMIWQDGFDICPFSLSGGTITEALFSGIKGNRFEKSNHCTYIKEYTLYM